jgi:hypothetical protein
MRRPDSAIGRACLRARPTTLALTLPLLLGGCLNLWVLPVQEHYPKVVAGKHEPNIVAARDGSTCRTSVERWNEARIGSRFFCTWTVRSPNPRR